MAVLHAPTTLVVSNTDNNIIDGSEYCFSMIGLLSLSISFADRELKNQVPNSRIPVVVEIFEVESISTVLPYLPYATIC
jgi:hypothetical protein